MVTRAEAVRKKHSPRYQTIAHQFLDIERDAGIIEATPSAYQTLDGILSEAQQRIRTPTADSKFEAIRILKTIDSILKEKEFKHKDYALLSEGLAEETPRPITCLGRTVIYRAIADILNLPIAAVNVPEHSFVRWHLKDLYLNWETTSGKELKDFDYFIGFNISEKAIENGVYLQSITEDEHLKGSYHLSVGYVLGRKGKNHQALQHYLKAVEINPKDPEALSNVGVLFMESKMYTEALSYFTRSLRLNPSACTYTNYGILYLRQGYLEKATFYFMKALELDPDYENANRGLAFAASKSLT